MNLSNRPSSSMSRRLPWIVATLLVAIIIITTFAFRTSTSQAPTHTGAGEMTKDSAGMGSTPAPAASNTGSADAFGADAAELARQKLAQHNAQRSAQRVVQRKRVQTRVDATNAALATKFRDEKSDSAWSTGKERRLAELSTSSQIKDIDANVENLSVDCKSTICRVTGDFASTSVGDDWFTLYMNNVGAEVPYAAYKYVPGKDGRVTIEIYAVGRK